MSGWIKTLGKDSLVYGIGYGVSRFLQIIVLPIIAQALTLSEFGYYSNYVIFYTFAGGFFIFGLDSAVTRFFFDSEDKKYHQQIFSSAFFFILSLSLLSVGAFYTFSPFVLRVLDIPAGYEDSLKYVLWCVPVIALNGFLLSWFKWKREKTKFLINSASTVVFLLLPLLLVSKVTFLYIFQVIFWSQLLIAVVSSVLAHSYIRFYFNGKILWSLLVYGFPWMLVFLFGQSRTYLDRMFLTGYLSDSTYGLYNFSIRVASLLSLVITAFDMSFGPIAFSIWNKDGARQFFAGLQSIYTFLISAFACSICAAAPLIIRLLGGTKYAGAEQVLPLLLFAAIPLSLTNFSSLGTNYARKSTQSTFSLFLGLLVVLLLNFILTARYLQYGAATASLVGHVVIVLVGYYLSAKHYKIPFAYGRDAITFLFFFALSLLMVNYSFNSNMYIEMLIELLMLLLVVALFVGLSFKKEYIKAVSAIRKRLS